MLEAIHYFYEDFKKDRSIERTFAIREPSYLLLDQYFTTGPLRPDTEEHCHQILEAINHFFKYILMNHEATVRTGIAERTSYTCIYYTFTVCMS